MQARTFVLLFLLGCSTKVATEDPPKSAPPKASEPAKPVSRLRVERSSPDQPPALVLAKPGGKGAAPEAEDTTTYRVVANFEEQYSIWPVSKEIPVGWKEAGPTGPRADCLAYIEKVWTDMRPLSLRKRAEEPPPLTDG